MSFPLFQKLLVELQSNCNRDCFFCNRPGDTSGKRFRNGKRVIESMPTSTALSVLRQSRDLGFKGLVAFHHMSEAFLDNRIIEIAEEAKIMGMRPYAHTNGDVLRKDLNLCKEVAGLFEYVVVGLYDYKTPQQKIEEERFWNNALKGTQVKFSYVGNVYPRTHTKPSSKLNHKKVFYPSGVCSRPFIRLLVHYDGGAALCCEDMEESFDLGNVNDTSVKDIWFGDKHKQILKDLNAGERSLYKLCSKCPIKPNQRRKNVSYE